MVKKFLIFGVILFFAIEISWPNISLARVTPDDIYQQRQDQFKADLSKILDSDTRQKIIQANQMLIDQNQIICLQFDVDIERMAAILEEEKARQHVTKTVVAYGQGNTPLDAAEYYLNYAEEAVAYQKIQDYTPRLGANPAGALTLSLDNLIADLEGVQEKVLKAKTEVGQAVDFYEK